MSLLEKSDFYEFVSGDEAELWGKRHYGEWAENYKNGVFHLQKINDDFGWDVIKCYCGQMHDHINTILRKAETNYLATDTYELMSRMLAVVIALAPRVPEDIIVYRGVFKAELDELQNMIKEGSPLYKEDFVSTSLCTEITKTNKFDALLRIRLCKGVAGIYASLVAGDRCEYELLLLPRCFIGKFDKSTKKCFKSHEKINDCPVYDCDLTYML